MRYFLEVTMNNAAYYGGLKTSTYSAKNCNKSCGNALIESRCFLSPMRKHNIHCTTSTGTMSDITVTKTRTLNMTRPASPAEQCFDVITAALMLATFLALSIFVGACLAYWIL